MNKEKIMKLTLQIEEALKHLKFELGYEAESSNKRVKARKSKKEKLNLETPIRNLLQEGFFSDWKTDKDVVKKLKQQVLNPKRASVSNVLRRFAAPQKGLLERQGEGTKKNLWRYRAKLIKK
jgi:hypothetical protein